MIFFDTTRASSWRHASGLARVSRRLKDELGESARGAGWPEIAALPAKSDWILTPELFSEHERPGFTAFLEVRPCRLAAIYHDAIPIKFPDITWPKSVERHPGYMKLLARFDRIWAVSASSRDELLGFWKWQGIASPPPVDVLALGADGSGIPRSPGGLAPAPGLPRIVSVGILEPRKNQSLLLDACGALRKEGRAFELHLVGRVNPHFGRPIVRRLKAMAAEWPGLRHHAEMDDAALAGLIRSARATAFPSIAEGYGLPLLESLWLGVPCVCSDLAAVAENAAGGGCAVIAGNGLEGWTGGLRRILTDDGFHARLAAEASSRALPTWAAAAEVLRDALA
jgi:glycosyltransferase involved in cell wall biosynthesis